VKATIERFGRLDVLVNNAGNFNAGFFEEISPQDFRAQIETTLFGPVNVTRAALPVMRAQRSGLLITISSTAGIAGQEFCTAYAASKFGVEGWIESLTPEVAPFGIRTMLVEPGFFRTELLTPESTQYAVSSIQDYAERTEQTVAGWKSMNGLQSGDPAKLAGALVQLASQDEPPLRFAAGADAVGALEQKARNLLAQASATANCPAASPTTTPEPPPNRSDQASRLPHRRRYRHEQHARSPTARCHASRQATWRARRAAERPPADAARGAPREDAPPPAPVPYIQRRRTTPMTPKLAGTAALVTGASSGIGAATARRLAQDGACVALVARRRDRLQALAADIENAGGTALAVEADITDRAQAEAAVQQAAGQFGRLDILVNNAGLMLLGPVLGSDPGEWDRMIAINVQGLLSTTRAALPHLLQAAEQGPRRVADIVNISSIAGRVAWNGYGVYSFTKFGVNGFTESLRQEVTQRHVRVGLVEPGGVATELGSHNTPEIRNEMIDPFYQQTEVLAPEDIADGIAYMVTRPRHTAIGELWIMPTDQV
jgi:NADP-dependent 3-hydroxy acid dehydrogenase YdfG